MCNSPDCPKEICYLVGVVIYDKNGAIRLNFETPHLKSHRNSTIRSYNKHHLDLEMKNLESEIKDVMAKLEKMIK